MVAPHESDSPQGKPDHIAHWNQRQECVALVSPFSMPLEGEAIPPHSHEVSRLGLATIVLPMIEQQGERRGQAETIPQLDRHRGKNRYHKEGDVHLLVSSLVWNYA